MFKRRKSFKTKYKKSGRLPVNSRIDIDYTGDKPKVKFGYPRKDVIKQLRGTNMNLYLTLFITFLIFMAFFAFAFDWDVGDQPTNCVGHFESFESVIVSPGETIYTGIVIYCDNHIYNYSFKASETQFQGLLYDEPKLIPKRAGETSGETFLRLNRETEMGQIWLALIFLILAVLIGMFVSPHIIWRIKPLAAAVPRVARFGNKGHYAEFKKVPKEKYVEIPLFYNIFLDYRATKEFSKYLTRVEIKDHPFWINVKKKGKRTRKRNISYWYARFYFSKIPKTGRLLLRFK